MSGVEVVLVAVRVVEVVEMVEVARSVVEVRRLLMWKFRVVVEIVVVEISAVVVVKSGGIHEWWLFDCVVEISVVVNDTVSGLDSVEVAASVEVATVLEVSVITGLSIVGRWRCWRNITDSQNRTRNRP